MVYILGDHFLNHPFGNYKPLDFNKTVLASEAQNEVYFTRGWSGAEPQWRWTDGKVAELTFQINEVPQNCSVLYFNMYPVIVNEGKQEIGVRFNRHDLGKFQISGNDSSFRVEIKKDLVIEKYANKIEFDISKTVSRPDLKDFRQLGFSLKQFSITCKD
jgi:hypothetical protein